MKLRDIPDPVWYGLLAVAAIGGVYWFSKRAAGAVGQAVTNTTRAVGRAAYSAGDAVQNAIVPGQDSLGTWLYGVLHPDEPDPTAPVAVPAKPAAYDYGHGGDSGIPYRPGAFSQPDPFNYDLSYLYGLDYQ